MNDFFKTLARAWTFAEPCGRWSRPALQCVRLQRHNGKIEFHATNGERAAILTASDSDMTGLDWDGEPCNLPPTVKLLMAEPGPDPLVVRSGSVSRGGISARVTQQDFSDRFPELRKRIFSATIDFPNAIELDGLELRKLWKVKPHSWPLQERVKAVCVGYKLPALRVWRDANGESGVNNIGLRIYDDGFLLTCGVDFPKIKDSGVIYEYNRDPIIFRAKNIETLEWNSREPPASKARVRLSPAYVLDALNGRKGVLHYGEWDHQCRIDLDDESHVIMPMRMI